MQGCRNETLLEALAGSRKSGGVRVGEDRYKSWWVPECHLTAFATSYSRAVVLGIITLVFWYRSHNSRRKAGTASVFFSTTYLYFSPWLQLVVCTDHVPDGIIGPFVPAASLLRGWAGCRLIRLCYRTVRETWREVISATVQHFTSTWTVSCRWKS